jgi:hypothetical protein
LLYGVAHELQLIPLDPELSTRLIAYTAPGARTIPLGIDTLNQAPFGCPNKVGTVNVTVPAKDPWPLLTPSMPFEMMFAVIEIEVGLSDLR